jgi:hypothetical protein
VEVVEFKTRAEAGGNHDDGGWGASASHWGRDLFLCQITRQTRNDGFSVPLTVADFESGRLAVDSFIRPQRFFTVEQRAILYAAGKIKSIRLQEVKARIRQLFA